jgi:hypothetical protein
VIYQVSSSKVRIVRIVKGSFVIAVSLLFGILLPFLPRLLVKSNYDVPAALYADVYRMHSKWVTIDPKPHDCEYEAAPWQQVLSLRKSDPG